MTWFVVLATGLLALALWPLLVVLLRPTAGHARLPAQQGHLVLLHAERTQLDADRAAGVIGADEYALAQAELARRVLQETARAEPVDQTAYRMFTVGFLLLALPVMAIGLYSALGQPEAISRGDTNMPEGATLADVDAMVRAMQATLDARAATDQPPDAQAWTMLARSQAGLQRFAQAAESYARALALDPDNPDLLADRADLVSLLQAPGFRTEASQLIQRALAIDPQHLKALALAGGMAYEQQDFAVAEEHWRRARAGAPSGSAFADGLDRSIEAARAGLQAKASGPSSTALATAAPSPTPGVVGGISGRVELSAALRARVQAGDTLFIVARTPQGPRMPLAVLRQSAGVDPVEFRLSDQQAMAPDHKLSGQPQVVLEARISRSGQALPQSGDLFGRTLPLANTAQGVRLVIDQIVP